MALALYRKYRPRTFAEVIGQEHVTEPLTQALRSGRLHHAYLFSGPRGCGKTSSARILARSLNCAQGPTPDPCGVCDSCKSLANDGTGSIDVIEIDAASHGGVDDARELREKAFFAPAASRYKIYVIDEAHMVSSAGFNALLKLVEEPPDYVKFIFATTEPEKVLGTIKSRTHHYPFRLIPPAVLRPYLQQLAEAEGIHVEPAVFPLVVRAGAGSARDSLSVLDQLIAGAGPEGVTYARAVTLLGVTDVTLIDEMCDALAAGDGAAAYATIDRVAEAGHDPRRFASDLLERFRDLIILQQVPDAVTKGLIDGPAGQLDAMSAQATRLGPATLSRCADIVHNGLVEMRGTTAPRLLLELITARMLLPGADDSTGALLQRLERMERRLILSADHQDHAGVRPQPASQVSPAGLGSAQGSPAGGPASAGRRSASADVSADGSPAGTGGLAGGSSASAGVPAGGMGGVGTPADDASAGAGLSAARAAASAAGRRAPGSSRTGTGPEDGEPRAAATESRAHAQAGAESPAPSPERAGAPEPARVTEPARASDPARVPADEPAPAVAPHARRPEPSAILPDAPEEPGAEPVSGGAPGQLTAAAVREVWPEIMTAVGRQSKKVAALATGATVRDLDGQTVVLTFRFPAHAKMVSDQPQFIEDALYEALGGRWHIRCEVAGEAGGGVPSARAGGAQSSAVAAPTRNTQAQSAPVRNAAAPSATSAKPARQREVTPPATSPSADDGDDDWPEPARPGGAASASASTDPPSTSAGIGTPADAAEDARAGGSEPSAQGRDAEPAVLGSGRGARSAPGGGSGAGAGTGRGSSPGAGAGGGSSAGAGTGRGRSAGVGTGGGSGLGAGRGVRTDTGSGPIAGSSAAVGTGGVPSTGLAAARAAAAGAARLATAKPATAGSGPALSAAGPDLPAAPSTSKAWSDGSPTEEAPYDPEFDEPPAGGAAYEGFDPGDEPLDDVIDEKTARQSSEQQAVQLLQEAFGAEKIGEA